MSEVFNTVWSYVLPIGGGITIGAIIIFVGTIAIKSLISKAFKKLDIQAIEDRAVEKGVEKVKTYTFKHDIQPLVNSELEKVVEKVDGKLDEKLDKVDKRYSAVIDCLDKFAKYFDNSIGVSTETKAEFKASIQKAKLGDYTLENKAVEENIKEEVNTAQNGNNAVKKGVSVVR